MFYKKKKGDLKHIKNILIIIFFIILACDVYAIVISNKELEMIFKPLLMPLLAGVYLVAVSKPNFWFLSALFFSFWGDVLLLFEERYFVLGLGSFLITHLLYVKLTSTFMFKNVKLLDYVKSTMPFVLLFLGLFFVIKNNLNEMLVPVLVYGLVISVFGTVTLLNYQQNKKKADLLLLLGAVIFMISDALIALNVFYYPKKIYEVLIIVLYAIAQYIVLKSMLVRNKTTLLEKC